MEKIFVIEPILDKDIDEEYAIAETSSLVKSAGGIVKGYECVRINKITPSTYIGKGKVEEIKIACDELGCDLIVFDGDLSPSQTLNLSEGLGDIPVIDRTTLILDIFALNAKTSEGKVQVELAQLKYIYPRLKGKGAALSRQGGGIGTRGPGESKLESDRRHIRRRMDYLENRLEELKSRRNLQTDRRKKDGTLVVSLVGYTNSGKSTLLNALTGSDVLAEDKLFATLDPTSRKLRLDDFEVLLVDTVGFIKNVPTSLIEAFGSTLESAVNSDLNVIVLDATNNYEEQLKTTTSMLDELGAKCERLVVFNKTENIEVCADFPKDALMISAKYGKGLTLLKEKIAKILKTEFAFYEFKLPYSALNDLRKLLPYSSCSNLDYNDETVSARIVVNKRYVKRFEEFIRSQHLSDENDGNI